MTKLKTKFLVRVDDVGQAEIQANPDRGMELFARWYDPWRGLPVYFGVVPAGLTASEFSWIDHNIPAQYLAIHGWDHARGPLSVGHIARAVAVLPEARVVIPPYNSYDAETVRAMDVHIAGTPVLLGGFPRDHHNYGDAPKRIGARTIHVSATRNLYDRCYQLADSIPSMLLPAVDYPLQIVLHHRWDVKNLDGVKRLRDVIADRMVTIDDVARWVEANG
jgi:hypothetical protein